MFRQALSRRRFLAGALGAGAAVIVAACAPVQPAPQPEAKPQEEAKPAPKEIKEIHFLCRTDIKSAYAADVAVEEWNSQFESQVTLDEPAGDVWTKVQAAIAAGDLVWDGYSVMETPWAIVERVKRGLIQPIDDYIEASTIPNADKVVPAIIPTIKESVSYEGKQYGIPGNVGSVGLAWFWEPLRAAGFEQQPETWDEVYEAARKIKESHPDLTPFASACTPLCDLHAMIWGAKEDPFDAEGLIDIRSEESIAALTWMRKMVEEELMPATAAEQFGNWLKGGIAIITSFDVAGTMAQQTFGIEAAETGINFFREKGKIQAGAPFWINSSVLFNKANNPQGMIDFFLWWFGPDNKTTGKQITEVAAKPCYTYTYEEFVKGKPEYAWEQKAIDLVAKSKWFRVHTYYNIERSLTAPYVEKCLDVEQKFEPTMHMQAAYDEIKTEISKQKFD